MNKTWLVVKETLISIALILAVLGVGYFVFQGKYPLDVQVEEATQYVKLAREDYKVVGDIQDAQGRTESHEVKSSELDLYQTEIRYVPGSVNPFVADNSNNDLPTETVSSGTQDTEQ